MGSVSSHVEPSYMAAQILSKTHYGTTIYSHILREYYPDEVVMTITGRDCGLCRNPFNANKNTLHIFIEKENILGNSLDREFAKHTDSENAIPAGDAFGFAELHYKQQGDELLQTQPVIYIRHELTEGQLERQFFRDEPRSMAFVCETLPKRDKGVGVKQLGCQRRAKTRTHVRQRAVTRNLVHNRDRVFLRFRPVGKAVICVILDRGENGFDHILRNIV